ncbi:MAG: CsgE family curli-type amyloid fiber assembly protein [Bacteroidota bacterium]|uniref:Curli production assembly/transport component CsgE n=1 Tax=Algoriphagus faecimaris TaxID=686796 RepID=A0A1G6UKL4_9BACT|nr:CsgE family curli-type amyloid fiber assembly protein [Algoriphagus faecimaris]SDD41784.1 curli production assembly/transport component CsgE [Algoriphagus faecimaris]
MNSRLKYSFVDELNQKKKKEYLFKVFLFSLCFFFCSHVSEAQVQKEKNDSTKQLKKTEQELKSLLEKIVKEEVKKVSSDAELEIDGLIVDETKTKVGRDFYDFFFRDWQAPEEASNYSIFIIEKPFRLNTTIIEIKINEITVFESFLQPRGDFVENLAVQSIANTQFYLQQYDELVRELGGEDTRGTGIY